MNRLVAILISFWLCPGQVVQAQDIRAASYQLIPGLEGGLSYLNNLKLYVEQDLDIVRDSVYVFTGTNYHWLNLASSENVAPGITCHTFQDTCLYPGPGVYALDATIPNRIENIQNMVNSENVPLRLQPIFIIGSFGYSSTPVCSGLQSNIIQTPTGAIFTPEVNDSDGDSLVFSLASCSGQGYYIPAGTSIDPQTGTISANPTSPGLYTFCTKIDEYRFGVIISTTYTDMVMQIDHVTGTGEIGASEAQGLFPNVISQGEAIRVRACGNAMLQLFDATGKTVFSRYVPQEGNIQLGISTGIYTYLLAEGIGNVLTRGRLIVL